MVDRSRISTTVFLFFSKRVKFSEYLRQTNYLEFLKIFRIFNLSKFRLNCEPQQFIGCYIAVKNFGICQKSTLVASYML